ncbi:helicase-related protein [Pelovirga terrestris]|uniref:DEAD/DEAH box helicase family protein n=1 Tax=Pelovirga terrestris TaxID=2771352 RepID=A0A8J6URT3_9BACT|nr:helicase-related protein [Pelovirga terrestris]MBD1401881.1 DEAD/DEAH box helicase family protein [Pelovirga terrestris]
MQIIDNINTLLGDDLKTVIARGSKLKIAASCFSIYAFEALKEQLESVESLEFIFTSPTFVPDEVTDRIRKERREFHIPKAERERSFYGSEFEIQLKNKLTQRAIAKECADWMRRKAVFRSNRGKAPMQQFACVQDGEPKAAYMPLHGFTAVDLGYQQGNAVSNFVNKLETFNGCILADSVGLGKTFTALAVIKYYELRNRSVLVLCPKKLADNWLNYNRNLKTNIFVKDRFNYDVLCHTDLQRTSGESYGIPLNRINWGNYDLVVIDESHNFRNNDVYKDRETRYQKLLNSVIREGVKTKVLMLSATPVNNRFNDLRNQLALAYEGDAGNLNSRLRTNKGIDEIFRRAQAAFNAWSTLPAEERTATAILNALNFDFFELLDSVTIARSRKHIETFYDTADIGDFPERRKPLSFHCQLTHRSDVIGFNEIFAQLSILKLAVYAPVSYILPSRLPKYEEIYDTEVSGGKGKLRQVDRERSLQALMTINLLKRLENSVEAFRLTLTKLKSNHLNTLAAITAFKETGTDAGFTDVASAFQYTDPDDDDLPDIDSAMIGGKIKIRLSDMDLPSWEYDLEQDLEVIDSLLTEMQKITPADDTKLQHLKTQIESKLASPINPGNKKVLIFTAFADTANYLYTHIADSFLAQRKLHTAKVTGSDTPKSTLKKTYDFQSLLTLFSPRSKEKAAILPDEPAEIDLLIGTDCISEGQNLQDCDYLINYDIHWNPVRIIQRFGRIDRIGSQNKSIQLVNYWPDITLDEYINLKERVENRMVIADVTATADDNILSPQSQDVSYRKEQLRRLQDEVIEMEDLKTGVNITDLGLNDFRMDLLNYVKQNGDLASVPNGMHAVVPSVVKNSFEVFFVDENALIACFDKDISEKLVKELAKAQPMRVVFRDSGFASDDLKINVEQVFRQMSPGTEVRAL